MAKKTKIPNITVPRALEDIMKESNELLYKLGVAKYRVDIHTKEAEEITEQLVKVNYEAAERNKLDAELKAEETNG